MNWLPETWIQLIGWTIVHSLWIVTLFALCLRLFLLFIPTKWAKVRYLLSLVSLIGVMVALVITGTQVNQAENQEATSLIDAKVAAPIVAPSSNAIESTYSVATLQKLNHQLQRWLAPHLPGILIIWFSGVLFFTLRGTGKLVYLYRLTHQNTQPLAQSWQDTVNKLTTNLRIRREVVVLISEKVYTPFVIGMFKPMILLPISAFSHLSPEQLEAILVHELAHIRRWDDMVNWLQTAVEVVLFYHPALWWISQTIRDEREKCCDDLAVSTCGSALVYAKALTQLESLPRSTSSLALAASRAGTGLLSRIERLLQPNIGYTKPSFVPVLITMILIAALVINYQAHPISPITSVGTTPLYSGVALGLPAPAEETTPEPAASSPWQPNLPAWLKEESSVADTVPSEPDSTITQKNKKTFKYQFHFSPDASLSTVDSLQKIIRLDSTQMGYTYSASGTSPSGVHILSLDSVPNVFVVPPVFSDSIQVFRFPDVDVDLDVLEDIDLDVSVLEDIEVIIDSVHGWDHDFNFHFSDTIPGFGSFPDIPFPPTFIAIDSTHRHLRVVERALNRSLAKFDSLDFPGASFYDSLPMQDRRAIEKALANLESANEWKEKALEQQLRAIEEQQRRYEEQLAKKEEQLRQQQQQWKERIEDWENRQHELHEQYEERVRELAERQEEQWRRQQELLQQQLEQKEKMKEKKKNRN